VHKPLFFLGDLFLKWQERGVWEKFFAKMA